MSGRSQKRKKREAYNKHHPRSVPEVDTFEPDPALFIQAYEADIVRGPQAWTSAPTLEWRAEDMEADAKDTGLMRWHASGGEELAKDAIWVDRYDARLLLDVLPAVHSDPPRRSLSPDGWSDLPSDAEDTFFLSRDEAEDYHRDKRRRIIEQGREERLRALQREDGSETHEEDQWEGSDEEPDAEQKELIRRTAVHVVGSPNPAQLEMRILANHGADRRFAFLRGRWSRAWRLAKMHAKADIEAKDPSSKAVVLGGLTGYGDSDSDDESQFQSERQGEETETKNATISAKSSEPAGGEGVSEDDIKEARRARAREWAANRRAPAAKQ